jgi:hypothetical protein
MEITACATGIASCKTEIMSYPTANDACITEIDRENFRSNTII